MKFHSFVTEIVFFSAIFIGLVVPSVFTAAAQVGQEAFTAWNFPWMQLIFAAAALLIYLFFYDKNEPKRTIWGLPGLHAFCWLLCVAFLLKFLSTLPVFAGTESKFTIEKPDSTLAWFFCILNFAAAAFYEEVIYRFYLTDALLSMISKKCGCGYVRFLQGFVLPQHIYTLVFFLL